MIWEVLSRKVRVMAYKSAKEITPEDSLRAKKIVEEMRKIMESTFLNPPDESNLARLRKIREELQDAGFLVVCQYEFNPHDLKLSVRIILYTLKEPPRLS